VAELGLRIGFGRCSKLRILEGGLPRRSRRLGQQLTRMTTPENCPHSTTPIYLVLALNYITHRLYPTLKRGTRDDSFATDRSPYESWLLMEGCDEYRINGGWSAVAVLTAYIRTMGTDTVDR